MLVPKRGDLLGNINGSVSIILMILVLVTLLDCIRKWLELLKNDKPVGMNIEEHDNCAIGNTKPNIPS